MSNDSDLCHNCGYMFIDPSVCEQCQEFNGYRAERSKKPLRIILCAECGFPKPTRHKKTRFCCKTCRGVYWDRQNREKKKKMIKDLGEIDERRHLE